MKRLPTPLHTLIFILVLPCLPYCQSSNSDGIFAFAYNKEGRFANQNDIPVQKLKTATEIFERLVEAKGVKNMPKPDFRMDNAERRPAWAQPAKKLIVLEEKAYDICMQLGRDSLNAIAALISHELIHYYEKHDWKDHFINKNQDVISIKKLKNSKSDLTQELQADHLGGLLAHMAGYNTLGVMPELLTKIYTSYNLNSADASYPSIDERRAVAHNSDILLTKYTRIFDMSVHLTAAKQYDLAKQYLHFLLSNTKFESREIYNNLGVLSTLMAINEFSATELKYQYPIEIALDTRLSSRSTDKEYRNKLLDEALDHFKTSNILDETFSQSLLNTATIYALKGEWFDAKYYAQKAINQYSNTSNESGISKGNILLGIISAEEGKIEEAKEFFIKANSDLGRSNLCLLKNGNNCIESTRKSRPYKLKNIDKVDLNKLYARIMKDEEQALLTLDLDDENSFHTIAKSSSEILVALNNRKIGSYALFQVINDDGIAFNRTLRVGATLKELEKSLGRPSYILTGDLNSIWAYDYASSLFTINADEKIIEWCKYKINL